jgi:hypothetical protein
MGVFAFAAKKKSGTTYLGVHTNSYTCGFEIDETGAGEVRGSLARWTQRLPAPAAPAVEAPSPAPTPEPAGPGRAECRGVCRPEGTVALMKIEDLTPEQRERAEEIRLTTPLWDLPWTGSEGFSGPGFWFL